MIHLNGNLLCAIDCETTGIDPLEHSIWQFCCLPVGNDLRPHKTHKPFQLILQPWSNTRDSRALNETKFRNALANGLPQETAANLFDEWFNRLKLPFRKRIIPLAHNWPFDREFIKAWLTDTGFQYYFDPRYRDTLPLAGALCDICDAHADPIPFESFVLRQLASKMEVDWDTKMAHEATYDAYKTLEVYRKFVNCATFIYH